MGVHAYYDVASRAPDAQIERCGRDTSRILNELDPGIDSREVLYDFGRAIVTRAIYHDDLEGILGVG
jgi:hypothetical protein